MQTSTIKRDNSVRALDRQEVFGPYMKPSLIESVWQLLSTLTLYALLWYAMYLSLSISYGLTLLLSIFAAGMLVRLFIMFHDCGHGNFFASHKTCNTVGTLLGMVFFVPFFYWKHEHAQHHVSVCNLDHQGVGDIWTLSIEDYKKLGRGQRLLYRLWRNPFILLGMSPLFIKNRFVTKNKQSKVRRSVFWMNIWVILVIAIMHFTIGLKVFLLVQVPILFFGSLFGAWLFFVQHQFCGGSWKRSHQWEHNTAVFEGTSYYKLPKILHWFTGNIGFHHIHHLCQQIPNYNLERCYNDNSMLQSVKTLTFWESLRSIKNRLWDEEKQVFVGF